MLWCAPKGTRFSIIMSNYFEVDEMIDKQQPPLQTRRSSAAALSGVALRNSRHYIPELDGLRAVAVLLVITEHLHTPVLHLARGHFGVVIFFILSGYLITSLALYEEGERGSLSFSGFYIRRSFRIFPLYYVVLAVYCVLILGLHIGPEKRVPLLHALPYYLTYFQEIPFIHGGYGLPFYQSWSLGIEEKFYLIWPIVCFLLLGQIRSWRIPVTAALIVGSSISGPFISPYSSILLGCLLALLFQLDWVRSVASQGSIIGSYTTLAILVGLHIFVLPHSHWRYEDAVYAPLFALFFGFLLSGETGIKSVLGFRPLVAIGRISYGIYLVHILCLNVVEKFFHSPSLSYLATVAASICVAGALHVTIERPLIHLGRRLSVISSRRSDRQLRPLGEPQEVGGQAA
jgi:peptidoglycan/LPS O-acetylase OafA/YrhL